MPAAYAAQGLGFFQGVYDIQVCASNSQFMYMSFINQDGAQLANPNGTVFVSSNQGQTWTTSGFTPVTNNTNFQENGDFKNQNGKIAIDPLITHKMPLDKINDAFDLMHSGESIRSVVVY